MIDHDIQRVRDGLLRVAEFDVLRPLALAALERVKDRLAAASRERDAVVILLRAKTSDETWANYPDPIQKAVEAEYVKLRAELAWTDPQWDATDGAHPCWWRGHDRGVAGMRQRLEEVTRDLREERSRANDYLEAVAQIRADRDAWRLRAEGAEACLRDCNSGGDVGVADRRRFILAAYDALPASPVSLTTVPEGQREHLVPNPTSQIPAEQTDNQGDRHGTEEV